MYHQREKSIHGKRYVLRKGYVKKAYHRKAYTRKGGIHVKAAKVGPVKVKATWIKKQGLTHGKYGLIPLKDYKHLRTFGYSFGRASATRHSALRKAIDKYGRNWVVRRLTAIGNVQPQTAKHASVARRARSDVAYVQKIAPSRTAISRGRPYKPRGLARKQSRSSKKKGGYHKGRRHVRRTRY